MEKIGDRPVSYTAAIGTHANYAIRPSVLDRDVAPLLIAGVKTPGDHNYEHNPFDILKDQTNEGPIWDVTKNFRGFWYTPSNGAVSLASGAGPGGGIQIVRIGLILAASGVTRSGRPTSVGSIVWQTSVILKAVQLVHKYIPARRSRSRFPRIIITHGTGLPDRSSV